MEPTGRARVNTSNSRAFAVCDRCGIWVNHEDLSWQFEWSATHLYNKGLLVCRRCLDKPFEQLRTIVLPPDPLPVLNARVENFVADEQYPFATYLTQSALKGSTTLYLNSVSGFYADGVVYIQMTNGVVATMMVLSINGTNKTITVNIPLPATAPVNGTVSTLQAPYLTTDTGVVLTDDNGNPLTPP